jgi:hypothetical protein
VLCNAAFWHFTNPAAVLGQVHAVLKHNGCFAFNLPDQEFDFGDGRRSEMARMVATCLHQPLRHVLPSYTYEVIHTLAAGGGFRVADYQIISVEVRAEDLIRFYSLPHVGARRWPSHTPEERRRLVAEAFGRLSSGERAPYRWAQFVLEPTSR